MDSDFVAYIPFLDDPESWELDSAKKTSGLAGLEVGADSAIASYKILSKSEVTID